MIAITVKGISSEKIETQYGKLTYYQYLKREKERIESCNPKRRCCVRLNRKKGVAWLEADQIAGKNTNRAS